MSRLPGESWDSFAERRIRQAQTEGMFDRLPGFGQPIPDIDQPWDESSWLKQKLREERINLLPPVLEARLDKERTLEMIRQLHSEAEVRRQLIALNDRIRQAHYAPQPGPAEGIRPMDVDAEVEQWRTARGMQK